MNPEVTPTVSDQMEPVETPNRLDALKTHGVNLMRSALSALPSKESLMPPKEKNLSSMRKWAVNIIRAGIVVIVITPGSCVGIASACGFVVQQIFGDRATEQIPFFYYLKGAEKMDEGKRKILTAIEGTVGSALDYGLGQGRPLNEKVTVEGKSFNYRLYQLPNNQYALEVNNADGETVYTETIIPPVLPEGETQPVCVER